MVVMPEVPIVTMMKAIVLVMIAAHPTVGVEHSRVHVSIPDDWRLRRSTQALLKRKPQAARRKWLEHGCLLIQAISVASAGWPAFADHRGTLVPAR